MKRIILLLSCILFAINHVFAETSGNTIQTITPSIVNVGKWAEGITFDGSSFWVAESGDRSIVRIDLQGNIERHIKVGRLPVNMVSLSDGRVYSLVKTDQSIWMQTPGVTKGRRLTTLPEYPQAMTANKQELWVLTWMSNSDAQTRVFKIDPSTGAKSSSDILGPGALALTAGFGKIWVTHRAHYNNPVLSIIDEKTLTSETETFDGLDLWSITSNSNNVFSGGRIHEDNTRGLIISIDPQNHKEKFRLLTDQMIDVITANDEVVVGVGIEGTIWVASALDLSLLKTIKLSIGKFRPSSAIIVGNDLKIVTQQFNHENGAVFTVSNFYNSLQHTAYQESCATEVGTKKHLFKEMYDKKQFNDAYLILNEFLTKCSAKIEPRARLWMNNDLALAAVKKGDTDRCKSIIQEIQQDPAYKEAPSNLISAVSFNSGLCVGKTA